MMKEYLYDGDIFLLPHLSGYVKGIVEAVCVTTNAIVKKDGRAVMGAGIAKSCRDRYPGTDKNLGTSLKHSGNHAYVIGMGKEKVAFWLYSFPTKWHWSQDSDPELIRQSCKEVARLADGDRLTQIYLPCPGCSNGHLDYEKEVRPILQKYLDDRFMVCIQGRIANTMAKRPERIEV